MKCIIAIEACPEITALGFIVSDLSGCFSAVDTLDNAIDNASEAIDLWYER
ncbi:MAG: hypothetical protein D4R63_03220 [Methylococcaceae bacterium]|nr:MAG: hypothetical protein D4R63_03220 [Methylococcaceae bacterium]